MLDCADLELDVEVVPDLLPNLADNLDRQAGPIFERASVLSVRSLMAFDRNCVKRKPFAP